MSDRNVSLLGRRDVDVNIHTIEPWPRPDRERGRPTYQRMRKKGACSTMLPIQNGRFQAPNVWKNDDSFDGKRLIDDDDEKFETVMMRCGVTMWRVGPP